MDRLHREWRLFSSVLATHIYTYIDLVLRDFFCGGAHKRSSLCTTSTNNSGWGVEPYYSFSELSSTRDASSRVWYRFDVCCTVVEGRIECLYIVFVNFNLWDIFDFTLKLVFNLKYIELKNWDHLLDQFVHFN